MDYAQGNFLLVMVGFGGALILAAMMVARHSWESVGTALKPGVLMATAATWMVAVITLGINVNVDGEATLSYLTVAAIGGFLVVGLPTFIIANIRKQTAMGGQGADATSSQVLTPSETDVEASEASQDGATATLNQGVLTPTPSEEPTQAPGAWLLFKSGPKAGQSVPIKGGNTSIGRAEDNDLVIDDPTVSRLHARLSYQDGKYTLEDMSNNGGTLVDGNAATKTMLSSGSTFSMGKTELVFMQAESTSGSGTTATGTLASLHPAETMVMELPQTVMAWLAVTAGPHKGNICQLKAGINTIGRDEGNDLVIGDPAISRRHALIKVQGDECLVLDLGSRGGTKVGAKTLRGKVLKTGEVITVGQTQLGLVEVQHPEPSQPATASDQTMIEQPDIGSGLLIVQSGPDAGKTFPLTQENNLIGREPECTVLLSDESVSRRHAIVRWDGDRFVVFDLGSRTGTQVGGEAIKGVRLSPGDSLSLGRTEMVLMQPQPQGK